MKSSEFCYWLQGMFELGDVRSLSEHQTKIIKQHLALVFKHDIDPSYGDKAHQEELQAIHDGPKPPHEPIGGVGPGGAVYRC